MLDEIYDPNGKLYRTLFRGWIIMDVNGKEYPAQNRVEAHDLRTGHKTVMLFDEIKFDQGLEEDIFTEKTLMRQRW